MLSSEKLGRVDAGDAAAAANTFAYGADIQLFDEARRQRLDLEYPPLVGFNTANRRQRRDQIVKHHASSANTKVLLHLR